MRLPAQFLPEGHCARWLALVAFGLTAAAFTAGHATAAVPAAKPNVVVILCDDYGYGSLRCYGADPA